MKRIFHTWDKWECYPARFYENKPDNEQLTNDDCERIYCDLLRDLPAFEAALNRVITEWPNSCEHYLSNENMNRIAWLGQASLCIAQGVPSQFRGGYNKLTEQEQKAADDMALVYLNKWLVSRGEEPCSTDTVQSKTKANIY